MRIVHIAAGAGQMYCGACARDLGLVRGLIARGHDVQIVPVYTPLRMDGEESLRVEPVFLGGINAYLQQKYPLLQRTPAFLDRLLDSPALLRLVSRFAISTRPSELGAMTSSVLAGSDGHQRKELQRLVDYLFDQGPPAVVVITNSLLSGLAPELKRQLAVPIVCGLQGEDGFIEAFAPAHAAQARELLGRNARSIDVFTAPSETYARHMEGWLGLPRESVRVVRTPLAVDLYRAGRRPADQPFTVGYLSVITPTKGLDLLVAAWRHLAAASPVPVRLRVAGRVLDRRYWHAVRRTLRQSLADGSCEVLGELDFQEKLDFLHSLSVLCVPSRHPETRGMVAMEAIAAGVPVLAPDQGIFPELLGRVGGGWLFPPGDVTALGARLGGLAGDPTQADLLGRDGAQALGRYYSPELAADEMLAVLGEATRARP